MRVGNKGAIVFLKNGQFFEKKISNFFLKRNGQYFFFKMGNFFVKNGQFFVKKWAIFGRNKNYQRKEIHLLLEKSGQKKLFF